MRIQKLIERVHLTASSLRNRPGANGSRPINEDIRRKWTNFTQLGEQARPWCRKHARKRNVYRTQVRHITQNVD